MSALTLAKPKSKIDALKIAGIGTLAAAGLLGSSLLSPAQASGTATPIEQVEGMVTDVGTIAGASVVVVLGAMGARVAIKLVNRVAVKG
jgi:hypothetical protein